MRLLLKPILGYYTTLDPLGYAEAQLDAMFMALGTMIARLAAEPTEHQLVILFSFLRTCHQVTIFAWTNCVSSANHSGATGCEGV